MDFGAFILCGFFLLCAAVSGFVLLITRPVLTVLKGFFVVSALLSVLSCLFIYKAFGLDEALATSTNIYQTDNALYLLDHGADPNAATEMGTTALLGAIGSDNVVLVQVLIAKGANVNLEGTDWTSGGGYVKATPLKAAMKRENKQIIKMLRDAGAKP